MKRVNFRSVEPNTQLLSHVWHLSSGFKERIDWKHLVGVSVSQWVGRSVMFQRHIELGPQTSLLIYKIKLKLGTCHHNDMKVCNGLVQIVEF